MKNACSQFLLLFLLSLSTSPPPRVEASLNHVRRIYQLNYKKTWNDAETNCISSAGGHGRLAIARNQADLKFLSHICNQNVMRRCWVGLTKGGDGVWRWINGQSNSLNMTWGHGNCATIYSDQLYPTSCVHVDYFRSLCENSLLVLVKENKTWEEALDHCRALGVNAGNPMDLFSPHDDVELSSAQEEMAWAQTEERWIGLRWLAGRWLWMDQTAGGTISLASECPTSRAYCGTLSGTGQHARNCMEKKNFFCL